MLWIDCGFVTGLRKSVGNGFCDEALCYGLNVYRSFVEVKVGVAESGFAFGLEDDFRDVYGEVDDSGDLVVYYLLD